MFFFGWPICLFSNDPDPYVSNIYREDTDHLPGKAIGEIDLMSRMTDDETLDSERIRRVCPSLTVPLIIDMDTSIIVHSLFHLCDPLYSYSMRQIIMLLFK